MKIIDSHVHIGLNEFCSPEDVVLPYDLQNDYDSYVAEMKKAGIEKACILPIPDKGYDIHKSNLYIKEAVEKYPDNFLPICRLDRDICNNINSDFCGAKLHKVYENISKNQLVEYYKLLEYYDRPLIVHAAFMDKVKQIKQIIKMAPNLKIILAHMGRGHIYTSEGVLENAIELKKYENVFFETSTVGNADTIEKVCNILGSERIMFGSDYPFGKIYLGDKYKYEDEIRVITDSRLSDGDMENILYETAKRIFRIDKSISTYITLYDEKYKENFENLFSSLSKRDKDFLAIDHKMKVIRECMRKKKHIYVIISENQFAGFFRESGRSNGYSLLEELVILPQFRGKGLANETMGFFMKMYPSSYAKTNSKNDIMNNLLIKCGYECVGGERILNWEKMGNRICS